MRLWHAVESAAEQFGARRFVFDTYGQSLTFQGFRDRAASVAAGLSKLGVRLGTRVSWQLPTGLHAAVLMAALSRLGAVQNPLIMSLRHAELRTIRDHFQPQLVIVPSRWRRFDHRAMAESLFSEADIFTVDHPWSGPTSQPLPTAGLGRLPAISELDRPQWVFVTSGTSKEPKGVRHTDESLWASSGCVLAALPLEPDDIFPIAFPLTHIGGVSWIVAALRTGFSTQLIDVFDPAKSPIEMASAGATILGSATPFFEAYLAAQRAHGSARLFSRLRFCAGGGAPISSDLDERVRNELGGEGVVNAYGLTECPQVGFPPVPDRYGMRARSSWMASAGVSVRIVDPNGVDMPAGRQGELRVRGPQMFSGYLDESSDADALDSLGYLRTGDLATSGVHGEVTITGRLKEVVIRKGENISMLEVEDVLVRHPDVVDAAVVGVPDAERGEMCCAAIVLVESGSAPAVSDLRDFCDMHGLAPFKAPERLAVVDEIPRNAMGKIQRTTLRDAVLDRLSSMSRE